MKKLQFLALTMLLSTPFAVTYTSADTATAGNTEARQSRQEDRQASRAARRAELASRESAVEAKKTAFMASDANLEAKENDFGTTLRAQIQDVESEISSLNLSEDQSQAARAALLNLHEERDTLRSRLERHKYKLQTRKSLLVGHVDCIQNHIADLQVEQAKVQDKLQGQASDNSRVQYLQGRLDEIQAEIVTKKQNLAAVQAEVDAAQASMDALQDRKATAKGQAVKSKMNQ